MKIFGQVKFRKDSYALVTTPRPLRWHVLYLARDSIYAERAISLIRPSVRPSVCHTGGLVKKGWSIGSCNFHHRVAQLLYRFVV